MINTHKRSLASHWIFTYITKGMIEFVVLAALLFFSWLVLVRLNVIHIQSQYFIDLAKTYLTGRLDLPVNPGYPDLSIIHGKIFTPHSLMPSLILVPIVYLWRNIQNAGLVFPLINILNFAVFYLTYKRRGFATNTILWLCLAFFVASPYIFVGSFAITWQMLLGTTFLLLAILEYSGKKRFMLIGCFIALAGLSRFTLFIWALFFLLGIVFTKQPRKVVVKELALFCIPIFTGVAVHFGFNYLRFGNIFESGYGYLTHPFSGQSLAPEHGFFNPRYIFYNLYEFFIHPPLLSLSPFSVKIPMDGIGIFFISPYLIWLMRKRIYDREDLFLGITLVVSFIPLVLWFTSGGAQFSFRFAMDFLPFVFLFLSKQFAGAMPRTFKTGIFISALLAFTLYYFYILNFRFTL